MKENFNNGMIIKLGEDSEKNYVIVENLKVDDKIYLLLTEIDGKIENNELKEYEIDYNKIFMVSYNERSDELQYDSNKEIIKKLVRKSIESN